MLKVGDRVSVYGYTSEGEQIEGFFGTVVREPNKRGWMLVYWDCKGWEPKVEEIHSKQCRRLVKKKEK